MSRARRTGTDSHEQPSLLLPSEGTAGAALDTVMRQARNVGERGRWFEDITLKLLAVEPDLAIADAWPWATWPGKPANQDGRDLGIDIVAEDDDGRLIAIQCKCQNDGTTLRKGSIDSFLAEAGARRMIYDELWIVSNVGLSRNAETALDNLATPCKAILFQKYSNTPLDAGRSPDRRDPNGPQRKAIEAVLAGFAERDRGKPAHDRGKLVMACGSGKTFTALRIAEALLPDGKPLVLFAAPSIALVGQARREWLTHCVDPLSTIVVCSSKAEGRPVSKDEAADISAHELSCRVTTDPAEIAEFMRLPKRRAVFCTYQSLARVADAQAKQKAPRFDLAIADEAHRTTGAFDKTAKGGETDWRLFLDGERLSAERRLYMTATPRVYTAKSKKDAASKRGVNVVDMDDEPYGKTFHELSFREAVKHGLLCDYRVVVLAVNTHTPLTPAVRAAFDEAFDEAAGTRKRRAVTGSEQLRLLGTSLAINGAIEGDTNELPNCLRRTLTFANTCAMSDWIARAIADGRTQRLTSFRIKGDRTARKINAVHLDATTPANKRLKEVDRLRNATDDECRMISNVRLFSEGIDIPALDGVVFFEARRAQIDIVQAVGRVMRKAPRKDLGFVVVPVVVPPGANVLDALANSDEGFDRIGAVLRALQSHDPSLADRMSEYVHIAQPRPNQQNGAGGTGGGVEGPPKAPQSNQSELVFDLSEAKDAIYAYIGTAAGFHNRKDLVESHIRAAVERAADMILDAELSTAMGEALGLPIGTKDERRNAATLAALLVVNGMILSHRLAPRIEQLRDDAIQRLRFAAKPYAACRRAWRTILRKDYAPIFVPALAVLEQLKDEAHARIITHMASSSLEVAATLSDFSYDHSGPLFHRILGKRGEADGAFYTNNLAALLLAGLAIPKAPGRSFRLIDPACGTGTLLLAALDTIKRHVMAERPRTDEAKLHKRLVEQTIHGLDINHHATQLAAANLTLGALVNFDRMNIATVREGVSDGTPYAGSLELLPTDGQQTLPAMRTPLPELRDLPGAHQSGQFDPKNMDLVISNPPYTEINKRLAKLPNEADKVLMRSHFQDIRESLALEDSLTADFLRGTRAVGPYFLPLASHLAKSTTGTLALVRPTSALTSPSGLAERRYLAQHFHLETTVTSHAKTNALGMGINFSESTNINETLMVLRRMTNNGDRPATKVVALHRQPESRAEVLELLDAICTGTGMGKFGRMGEWPGDRVASGDWSYANWYDETLADAAAAVQNNTRLQPLSRHATFVDRNPNFGKVYEDAGDDAERHIIASVSADLETVMCSTPRHGVRLKTDADLKFRDGIDRPASTFLAYRVSPSTLRAIALRTTRPCLSTAYIGIVLRTGGREYANAVVAFLNSTLGWLQVLNQRAFKLVYTRITPKGAGILCVPPPGSKHITAMAEVYRKLVKSELSSPRNPDCPVRIELDRVAARATGMPVGTLRHIRRRIAAEPSVAGTWSESED